jgi:hypothetical protein
MAAKLVDGAMMLWADYLESKGI